MSTIERRLIPDRALAEEIERREEELRELRERLAAWREKCEAIGERDTVFTSISDREILPVYTPVDRAGADPYLEALSLPGEYPFTRGPYATMYRTRLWTKRQFAGFADAEETNARYKYLLAHRQTGLSVAFDFPTLMGYDSDHQRALGEVGVCGVAISSPRGHGDALRRDPARRGVRLHDDQRTGSHPVRVLRGRGRETEHRTRPDPGHGPERHPEGVIRRSTRGCILRDPRCA